MTNNPIYLDNAAATPLDASVLDEMLPYLKGNYFNPSATYLQALHVKQDLDKARNLVANNLGARPQEIIFTAGASEANNLAIRGILEQYEDANVVISSIEHESVLEPAKQYDYREVIVKSDGRLDLDDLDKKIDDKTVLVSIMLVNNEIGTLQPINEVAKLIEKKKKTRKIDLPLLLHSDGAQAANYLDLHVSRLKVDLMSINGGKIYGPKQSGCLYVKRGLKLKPLIFGGGQEQNLRSGTESVAGIIGFASALDKAQLIKHSENKRLAELQSEFIKLIKEKLPSAQINGSIKHRLVNNLHLTFPDVDNETLLLKLEKDNILAAAGSACSASNDEPSHVLKAIGLTDKDARSSIRFSMGRNTTLKDIKQVVQSLVKNIA
jgi:cysteine desulfurase